MDRFGRAFNMKILRMHAKMIPGLEVECLLDMTFFPNHAGKQACGLLEQLVINLEYFWSR